MKEKVNVDIEITGLEELLNITREIHECVRKASSLKRELAKACDNVYIELKDLSIKGQTQSDPAAQQDSGTEPYQAQAIFDEYADGFNRGTLSAIHGNGEVLP